MGVKCNCLRFLFIDEIEACGLKLLSDVEEATRRHGAQLFKNAADTVMPRVFGGLNVFFLGDFWQLPPTGQIAIMSNPYSRAVLESAKANSIMAMFWLDCHREALQKWPHNQRVLHLDVNKRSGKDAWFSKLLDDCREGQLTENDFNYLHGFPTMCRANATCTDRRCDDFEAKMKQCIKDTEKSWETHWRMILSLQCPECQQERKRRIRVMHSHAFKDLPVGMPQEDTQRVLQSDRFADSVYITECNKPVCVYGMMRAQNFARVRKQQLLWIQSEDIPPTEHYAHYNKEELIAEKQKWNSPNYHARKTDGIPSLMPLIYDMPWRLTGGQGGHFKECGIHNGTRGHVRAWTLHEEDEKHLKACNDEEIVLKHMPLVVWLESDDELKIQHPAALKKNWFPMRPITNSWSLDANAYVEIARKGFAAVPDFASTIHVATGRSLKAVIPDLGGVAEPASFSAMMRGYIALSRATDANGVLIARPFSPTLFALGPQPFATLLLETLQGKIPEQKLPELWATAAATVRDSTKSKRLMDKKWTCGVCDESKTGREFIEGMTNPDVEDSKWPNLILERVLAPGPFRRCSACDQKRRCSECNLEKPKKDFSDRSWKNALRGTGLCLKCTKTKQSITCYICGTTDNTCFSDSGRKNKINTGRNVRCNECSHPECSVPGCTTCKSCRHLYRA